MSHSLKLISLAGVFAFAAPVFAQETTTPATEAPVAAEAGAAEVTPDPLAPNMGEVVVDPNAAVDPNAPGTPYVREEIGDWKLRCIKVPDGQQEPCQLYQLLKDEGDNGVAEINLVNLPAGQQAAAGATITTPLETLLTQQLTIQVDGGAAKRYPFTWCDQGGCYSRIGFSNADIAQFKRGAGAKVTVVPIIAPDQKVTVNLSLTGFTKAYDTMLEANKPTE